MQVTQLGQETAHAAAQSQRRSCQVNSRPRRNRPCIHRGRQALEKGGSWLFQLVDPCTRHLCEDLQHRKV